MLNDFLIFRKNLHIVLCDETLSCCTIACENGGMFYANHICGGFYLGR